MLYTTSHSAQAEVRATAADARKTAQWRPFEGAVAKAAERRSDVIVRAKAKTQRWIDRVMEIHGPERGRSLIES